MESLLGISRPTVKNRLSRIVQQLDASIMPPTADNTEVPNRKELMASPPRHRRVRGHAEPDLSVERDKGEQIRVYCE